MKFKLKGRYKYSYKGKGNKILTYPSLIQVLNFIIDIDFSIFTEMVKNTLRHSNVLG